MSVFSACGKKEEETDPGSGSQSAKPLRIVTTVFPFYDWARNILGNDRQDIELIMLIDNGVDPHSYQPSVDDILTISESDLFIYGGGESDEWVSDALAESVNSDQVVLNLIDLLGDQAREEETKEGMKKKREEESSTDEHIWLSLRNAKTLIPFIEEAIEKLDPSNADLYRSNSDSYLEKLDQLDAAYEQTVSEAPLKTLLFADRFPFLYMTEDYGLDYYAAFAGCSAETEADFETISFLIDKINELSLHTVLIIEGSDDRLANTIIQSTKTKDQKIGIMDSIQSVTEKDVREGADYLDYMQKNLKVLAEALQ